MPNIREKMREVSVRLRHAGIDGGDREAEIIMREALQFDLAEIYGNNPLLDSQQTACIDDIVSRRCRREPLQYILGSVEFMGLRINVGTGVLIPRPETELLAESAISFIKGGKAGEEGTVLDLCSGSGCVALAVARAFPGINVYGIDNAAAAVEYGKRNAAQNGIKNALFIQGSLFEPLGKHTRFDMIISNPPYIRTGEIRTLQPEVRDWEPSEALDGGQDGLVYYREIIPSARKFLKNHGILMLELGDGCADAVSSMAKKNGYEQIHTLKDYAGIERICKAKWIN